jgi:hypothetical protein
VHQLVRYLRASMTLEEAASVLQRMVALGMSARQALNLLPPVGAARARQADAPVERIGQEASQKQTGALEAQEASQHEELDGLYSEMDGVRAGIRRGRVLMEALAQPRAGDV